MLNLDPTLVLLLIASLYILVFGGLSFLRRESPSVQFALEAVGVTALLVGGSWLLGIALHPILLLLALYLVTMRSRLVVELANLLARRGQCNLALRLYSLGLAWWPDASSRLIVLANRGAAELCAGQVETAIQTLEGVLVEAERPSLGVKYEAATRYNLGCAYGKKGEEARATAELNEAIDLLPGSAYARAAAVVLERRRRAGSSHG
jgi:tetratricopeptide (TPR) repeat protein